MTDIQHIENIRKHGQEGADILKRGNVQEIQEWADLREALLDG